MKIVKVIYLGLALSLGFSSAGLASMGVSACHGNGGYPPYHYVNPDEPDQSKMIGISIDLVEEIFDRLAYDITIKPLPWKRCFNNAKKGLGYDIIVDGSYKKDREAFFIYTDKIHTLNPAVVIRATSPWAAQEFVGPDQLKDAVICSNRGTNLTPYGVGNSDIAARASGVAQGLKMVANSRCDGYLTLHQVFEGHYNLTNDVFLPVGLISKPIDTSETFDLHLMISKRTPDASGIVEKINSALKDIHKDGSFDRLWEFYRK